MTKFRADDPIIITKNRKAAGEIFGREKKRIGVLDSPDEDEYLKRRGVKSGLLNFYDLGQILIAGLWKDLDFSIEADFSTLASIVDVSLIETNVIRPIQAEINGLNTKIFEIDLDDWKTAYRKLDFENAYKYNALVRINNKPTLSKLDSTNADWTTDGLKEPSVSRIALYSNFGGTNYTFLPFDTGDTEKYKITESYDYDADAAAFTGSSEMDVFLLPSLAFQGLFLSQSSGDDYALYLNFKAFSRERMLDDLQFVNNLPIRFDETIETFEDWTNYFKSLEFSRTLKINSSGAVILDAEDFPAPDPADIKDYELKPAYYQLSDAGHRLNQFYAGKLLAIIKTNSKTFYIWAKTDLISFG